MSHCDEEAMEKNKGAVTSQESEIKYGGVKAMPYIIGNESFEKLGTIGTSANLLVYLTNIFHMKSITATTLVNVFNGTTSFATLPGAFLCDTYFGRYKTLGFASVASFLGMLVITLTAAVPVLHPPPCNPAAAETCRGATPWQMSFLLMGLGLLVVGAGGIRPCNLAFGADQFNPKTEAGKKGISSFFNWYYMTYTSAMMISSTLIVYLQTDVSWAWGLAIPCFLMLLSCSLFFLGSRIYVKMKPNGSPLTSVAQVVVAALRKRRLKHPEQPWLSLFNHTSTDTINSKLPYTEQFRFLDKAAIITAEDESKADPWRLCSMQQVEEVKCLVRILPIWVSNTVYIISLVQQQTYVVFQALQFDRRVGGSSFIIPAASYTLFIMISLTVWIPIYDRLIVPMLRRITKLEGGITVLQKMGVGKVIAVATMLVSALVEERRKAHGLVNPVGIEPGRGAISSLSSFWLVPQLTLAGLSEAFTIVGMVEFYYKQFPENMRSIGGSFPPVAYAGSNYLSGLLVVIVHRISRSTSTGDWLAQDLNKARLDYYYFLIAALMLLNLGYFIVCARWYRYRESGQVSPELDMGKMQPEKQVA